MATVVEPTIGGAICRFRTRFYEVSHYHHDVIHSSPTRPHATAGQRPARRDPVRASERRGESGRCDRRHLRRIGFGWPSRFVAAKHCRCSDCIWGNQAIAPPLSFSQRSVPTPHLRRAQVGRFAFHKRGDDQTIRPARHDARVVGTRLPYLVGSPLPAPRRSFHRSTVPPFHRTHARESMRVFLCTRSTSRTIRKSGAARAA